MHLIVLVSACLVAVSTAEPQFGNLFQRPTMSFQPGGFGLFGRPAPPPPPPRAPVVQNPLQNIFQNIFGGPAAAAPAPAPAPPKKPTKDDIKNGLAAFNEKFALGAQNCKDVKPGFFRPHFWSYPMVCVFEQGDVVTESGMGAECNLDALKKYFSDCSLESPFEECYAETDYFKKPLGLFHLFTFGLFDCGKMDEELRELVQCVKDKAEELCNDDEDEDETTTTEAPTTTTEEATTTTEEPTTTTTTPEPTTTTEECVREDNYQDFYPKKEIDYPEITDTSVGPHMLLRVNMNKDNPKLATIGVTDIKGLICLYIEECRSGERFLAKMTEIEIANGKAKHIYKQLNEYCDAAENDCEALCQA